MSTKRPKSKKNASEQPPEAEAPMTEAVSKKVSKKASAAKAEEAAEPKAAVETVENRENAASKKRKAGKAKVIRDSFSFPEQDYRKISELKKACLAEGVHVKKGELLRAGLHLLSKLNLSELKQAVEKVEKVKTGRPGAST